MTDMREAVARAIWEAGANASTMKWQAASYDAKLIVYKKAEAVLPEIDRRVADERAKLLERLRDDLNIAIELIQEAKGYEGPKGGPITDHLDAAEGWIDRVLAQFEKENSDEQG